MNIGFYIDSLKGEPETVALYKELNDLVESDEVNDVSLFYNQVDFNPENPKFGLFNASDAWCFTGTMVANSIRNATTAANMINKFKLVYLYNKNDKNIFELLSLPEGVPILANTEEEAKYIYRVSGKPVRSVVKSIKDIIEVVK